MILVRSIKNTLATGSFTIAKARTMPTISSTWHVANYVVATMDGDRSGNQCVFDPAEVSFQIKMNCNDHERITAETGSIRQNQSFPSLWPPPFRC